MPMTAYLRKKLGDHSLGKAAYTMPTNVTLALFKSSPTDAGLTTDEVTGGSYARLSIGASMGSFDLTTSIATSTADINFATPTADWGTVTHIGIMEVTISPDVANMLYYEALPVTRSILSGSRPLQFQAGQLRFLLT